MRKTERGLRDLVSVGPATLRDFDLLGIHSVAQLAAQHPEALYERLCLQRSEPIDMCSLDVFHAAVAQARDPQLAKEQCQWWYWTRQRKMRNARS